MGLISACYPLYTYTVWDTIMTLYDPFLKWLFGVIAPIGLAAWLAYRFGLETYLKQRQHELILKRYLEDGIDRVSLVFDDVMGTYYDNYRTVISALKAVEHADFTILNEGDYSISIKKYDKQCFAATPFYKLSDLLGDTIFWDTIRELMFTFVDRTAIFYEKDFHLIIKEAMSGGFGAPKDKIPFLSALREQLQKYTQDSFKYLPILCELQTIARILEKETGIGWKELGHFKNRPDVKEAIQRLKDKFRDDLVTIRGLNNSDEIK